jgi:hypothetical protein
MKFSFALCDGVTREFRNRLGSQGTLETSELGRFAVNQLLVSFDIWDPRKLQFFSPRISFIARKMPLWNVSK